MRVLRPRLRVRPAVVGSGRGTEIRAVTIARLRRKLGEPDVITATRGVGSRIADAASPPS